MFLFLNLNPRNRYEYSVFIKMKFENFYFGWGLLKRFAPFSYLDHSFILSLNVKVCIRFIAFLKISLCFLFVKCYVGWQVCALASHFHVFCFQSEGGVKSLRTRVFKNFRTGRVGGYQFGGRLFLLGGQYPITCHEKWEL